MARLNQLHFDVLYHYRTTGGGIVVPVDLVVSTLSISAVARLDTGASECLFDQSYAELLGLDVESGYRRVYRTVAGSFVAYGHEVTLRTQGLEWNTLVYFYAARDGEHNFLGRNGWLNQVRLGLVHYDQLLYLSRYGL